MRLAVGEFVNGFFVPGQLAHNFDNCGASGIPLLLNDVVPPIAKDFKGFSLHISLGCVAMARLCNTETARVNKKKPPALLHGGREKCRKGTQGEQIGQTAV